MYQAARYRCGEASALNAVGWFHAHLDNLADALSYCGRAAALHHEIGDPHNEAAALDSLGYIHRRLGQPDAAVRHYRAACALFRELGDRYEEAESLLSLGDTHAEAGDTGAARAAWRDALHILDALDPPEADRIRTRLPVRSG